jgi:hypothetical protein
MRDGPGYQQEISESRRSGKMDTEAFAIIEDVVHGVNLQFASIAGTRVHLSDRQAPAESPPDDFIEFYPYLQELGLQDRRERFRYDAGAEYLLQNAYHTSLYL